jgi:hypothetical protein
MSVQREKKEKGIQSICFTRHVSAVARHMVYTLDLMAKEWREISLKSFLSLLAIENPVLIFIFSFASHQSPAFMDTTIHMPLLELI